MVNQPSLLFVARDLLESECLRRTGDDLLKPNASGPLRANRRPIEPEMVDWLLPQLVDLIDAAHDQPVKEIEYTIRLCLLEQSFVEEGAGNSFNGEIQHRLDELVDLLVGLLEQVRQHAITEGRWSDAPVTPQIFG